MYSIFKKIFPLIFLLFFVVSPSFANDEINLLVSPVRYEFKLDPGDSITEEISLLNKGDRDLFITTGKINVASESNSSVPIFIAQGNPNQELESWITLTTNSINVGPLEEQIVNFTINVPSNATPGGHYGAVYFEYDSKKNGIVANSGNQTLNVKANYHVLLLVEVNGDIKEGGDIGETEIILGVPTNSFTPGTEPNNTPIEEIELNSALEDKKQNLKEKPGERIDNCPLGDFSPSNYDGVCFDEITIDDLVNYIRDKFNNSDTTDNTNNDKSSIPDSNNNNLEVDFTVPFINSGNTHLKPKGEITFYDEDGNQINGIGTEYIIDENGVTIGEKITDYIPINQEKSNVLPDTQRDFSYNWKGFPYETIDESGKLVIKYRTPADYFSKNYDDNSLLYPWQRLNKFIEYEKINTITKLEYTQNDGEIVEFNSADEFYIEYEVNKIGYDIYFLTWLVIFLFIIIIFFFIFGLITKKKCHKCKKKIKKKMKVCPYCGARQKK